MKRKRKQSIGLCNCSLIEFQKGVEFLKETDAILDEDIFIILKRVCSYLFFCVKNGNFENLMNLESRILTQSGISHNEILSTEDNEKKKIEDELIENYEFKEEDLEIIKHINRLLLNSLIDNYVGYSWLCLILSEYLSKLDKQEEAEKNDSENSSSEFELFNQSSVTNDMSSINCSNIGSMELKRVLRDIMFLEKKKMKKKGKNRKDESRNQYSNYMYCYYGLTMNQLSNSIDTESTIILENKNGRKIFEERKEDIKEMEMCNKNVGNRNKNKNKQEKSFCSFEPIGFTSELFSNDELQECMRRSKKRKLDVRNSSKSNSSGSNGNNSSSANEEENNDNDNEMNLKEICLDDINLIQGYINDSNKGESKLLISRRFSLHNRKDSHMSNKSEYNSSQSEKNSNDLHYLYKALCDFLSTKYETNKLLKYMDEYRDMYSWKPPQFYWPLLENRLVVKEILKLYEKRYLDPFLSCLYEDFINKYHCEDKENNNITTYTSNFNVFTLRISEEIQKFIRMKEPEQEQKEILNICKNVCVSENSYIYTQLILEYIYRNNNDTSMRKLSQYLSLYVLYNNVNIYEICNDHFYSVPEKEVSIVYLIFKMNNLHNYKSLYTIFKHIFMNRNKGIMNIGHSDMLQLYKEIIRILKIFNGKKLLLFDSTYLNSAKKNQLKRSQGNLSNSIEELEMMDTIEDTEINNEEEEEEGGGGGGEGMSKNIEEGIEGNEERKEIEIKVEMEGIEMLENICYENKNNEVNSFDNENKTVSEFMLPSASQYGDKNYNYKNEFLRINIYAERIPLVHMRDLIFINNIINMYVTDSTLFSKQLYQIYAKVLIFLTTYSPYEYVYNHYYNNFLKQVEENYSSANTFFKVYDDNILFRQKKKKKKKKKQKKQKQKKKKKLKKQNKSNELQNQEETKSHITIWKKKENKVIKSILKKESQYDKIDDEKVEECCNSSRVSISIEYHPKSQTNESSNISPIINEEEKRESSNLTSEIKITNCNKEFNSETYILKTEKDFAENSDEKEQHEEKIPIQNETKKQDVSNDEKKEETNLQVNCEMFELKTDITSGDEIKSSVFKNVKTKKKLRINASNKKKRKFFYNLFTEYKLKYNEYIKFIQIEIFHIYNIIHSNESDLKKDRLLLSRINSNLSASIVYRYIYVHMYEYVNSSQVNLIYSKLVLLKQIIDNFPQKRFLVLHFLKQLYIYIIEEKKSLEEFSELRENLILYLVYMIRYENMFCYVVETIKSMAYALDKSLIRLFIVKTLDFCGPPYNFQFSQTLLKLIYLVLKTGGVYYKGVFKTNVNKFLEANIQTYQIYPNDHNKDLWTLSNYIKKELIKTEQDIE